MKKTKILLFSKESRGGIGTFLNNFFKLSTNRYKLGLYLYKKDPLFSKKTNFSVHYIDKNYPSTLSFSLEKIYKYFIHTIKSLVVLLKEKPDFVCCNDTYSMLTILPLKLILRKKIVISIIHSNLLQTITDKSGRLYKSVLMAYYSFLLKNSTRIVFVSNGTRKNYMNVFHIPSNKTITIYYGISLPKYQNLPRLKSEIFRSAFNILSVGRFEKQKDFPLIINAVSTLLSKFSIELYLIGAGVMKNSLVSLSKRLGVENKVHFLNWKSEIYKQLIKADLFVFASRHETFGLTIVEAMACGIPVVSTNTKHGPSEILGRGQYGLLTPVGNQKKLAESIKKVLVDDALRKKFARLAYERAQYYSVYTMLKHYSKMFTSLSD